MCCRSTREGRELQSKTGRIRVSYFEPRPLPRPVQSQDFHRVFEQVPSDCVCMSVCVERL